MAAPNDPQLVAKALAKALSLEARLNALVASQGAPLIAYNPVITVVQQAVNGAYTWTCPAGVTSVKVECWGAGAGAGGGISTLGAEGGGGGAYSSETYYGVTPGAVYRYIVGAGGAGAVSNAGAGTPGGPTYFDIDGPSGGVYAAGGGAGSNGTGGTGGAANAGQLISFAGGNGGGDGTQSTGGCGGGSSASPSANGNNGAKSTSATGAAGGAGSTDQGAGGTGGNAGAAGTGGGLPGAGGGGCGAAASPAGLTILSYNPTLSATYYGSDAVGGSANLQESAVGATMWQGGNLSGSGIFNGTMKSVMILPSSVSTDLSAVTVDTVTLTLLNDSTYYGTGAAVALGYAAFTSLAASYDGVTGLTSVMTFTAPQGVSYVQQVTSALGTVLKSGAAKALVFGPGPAGDLAYFSSFAGAGQSGTPLLTITGHTGAALNAGGGGADGQVRLTYTTPGVAVGAIQPLAVSDSAGNALAVGYTGNTSAIQPGSNPAVLEVPHAASLANSWTGTLQYKKNPDNTVTVKGLVTAPAGVANPSSINTALGTAYQPATTEYLGCVEDPGGAHLGQAIICQMQTNGQIQVFDATAGDTLRIFGRYTLDF